MSTKRAPKGKPKARGKPIDRFAEHMKRFDARFREQLQKAGVLQDSDLQAYELMAQHWVLAQVALDAIRAEGMTRLDENKVERKHPMLQIMRDNSVAFRSYAMTFGLVPTARGALKDLRSPSADPFEEFLGQRVAMDADSD